MFNLNSKLKANSIANEETGTQFYNPITHQDEESFSYQIQMEKEYVQRLKMQREKIQTLYSKYDLILNDIKKKDSEIREKQDKIKLMDNKLKDLELNCQEMNLVKEQNRQLMNENLSLKHRVLGLQNQNSQIIQQIKLKQCLVTDEKDELDHINDQLQQKVRSLNNKMILCQEQFKKSIQVQRQRAEILKTQHLAQVSHLTGQINILRNEIMKRDETVHMMRLDNEFLQQKLADQEENYSVYLKDLETKIQKNQRQKKLQIKSLKDVLQQRTCEITTLQSKITTLKQELQIKQIDLEEVKKVLREQKRVFDQDIFQLKSQMNNEKSYFREQFMYCQNHYEKVQKKLAQSLKRQKDLTDRIKKFETNQIAKRNFRQIQRQQLQKINKILSLQ